jgi:hypothetical protein
MPERTLTIDGVEVPRFLYGTAWKEDQTQRLARNRLGLGLHAHGGLGWVGTSALPCVYLTGWLRFRPSPLRPEVLH